MSRSAFFFSFVIGYGVLFIFRFPLFLPFLFFFSGLLIGYYFHVFDRVVQIFAIQELSSQKKQFFTDIKKGNIVGAVLHLVNTVEPISSSFYFLILYFPLAVFMISSTGSIVGIALILGLGLSYVAHFIWGHKNIQQIRESHFHLLKQSVTQEQITFLMGVFILLFVVLSFMVFNRG